MPTVFNKLSKKGKKFTESMQMEIPPIEDVNRSRNSHFFILCFTILTFFNSIADKVQAKPMIKLEKRSFDLGKLDPDGKINELHIAVANMGTDTLEIDFVGSSCGCITVESIDQKIYPGKNGRILLAIDPSKIGHGYKQQKLLFTTNDPNEKQVMIGVHYRTKLAEVAISPTAINVELSKEEMVRSKGLSRNTITVVDSWINRLEISDIRTSSHLTTSFYDILYRCPKGMEAHVLRFDTQLSRDLPVGSFNEWISFSTNHPKYPTMMVPLNGQVVSSIKVKPKILIIHAFPEKQTPLIKTVTIEVSRNDETLEIQDVRCSDTWIKVEQIPIDERKVSLSISIEQPTIYLSKGPPKIIKSIVLIKIKEPDLVEETVQILILPSKSNTK